MSSSTYYFWKIHFFCNFRLLDMTLEVFEKLFYITGIVCIIYVEYLDDIFFLTFYIKYFIFNLFL